MSEQPSKRQRVDETVEDIIARTAEKAASDAAAKCNAFWEAKMRGLAAHTEPEAKPKIASAVTSPDKDKKVKQAKGASCACTADEACMQTAVASATVGVRIGHGGPFGASIVRDGVIIACAHNMVLHNADPTCHAEMTAIRQACTALGTHDLSDCSLYTTCEPCPMCWGAAHWSRLNKVYIGVDRHIAAKYGFDDKVFYEEIDGKSEMYGWKSKACFGKKMVDIYDGVLREECEKLFTDPAVNQTYRRRYAQEGQEALHQAAKDAFPDAGVKRSVDVDSNPNTSKAQHESFMRMAVAAVKRGAKGGMSKEREPFGAVIVKDGKVIATACNSVCNSRDCTATAEVKAIQLASANLCTYNLEGCEIYTTVQPDLMSLGAILWSRISRVYCGVTQKFAAQYGFEEASLHFKDLLEGPAAGESKKGRLDVVQGVAVQDCEGVFQEWSDRNGKIY